jgi:hypothetical protein
MRETRAEKNYISKDAFRKWVRAMHQQFVQNRDAIVCTKKNCTYVYLRSKVGIARKSPNDKNNDVIGIAYAWARCTGQPIYYEKEQKRYTPKAGEWVCVNTVNDVTRVLMFIIEGIDNYCFSSRSGHLVLIDKDKMINITSLD